MPALWNSTADPPMIASDNAPPSGNPRYTFARFTFRSFGVQWSSTAPEEKKNTSYGVIAAPSSAIAKNAYVPHVSVPGGPKCDADANVCERPGSSRHRANAVTISAHPESPKNFSIAENRTFHSTIHTAIASIGTHSR